MTDREVHILANSVACPFCGASVGAYCHGRSGQRMVSKLPHNRRLVLARAQRARDEKNAVPASAMEVLSSLAQLHIEVRALRNEVRVLRRSFK